MTTTGLDTSSSEMQERIARIAEQSNLSPISDDTTPATLAMFLAIYLKSKHECYIDYMEGASMLHRWLTSDGAVPFDTCREPLVGNVPSLCMSYDMVKLAEIVGITFKPVDTNMAVRRIYAEVIQPEVATNDNLR